MSSDAPIQSSIALLGEGMKLILKVLSRKITDNATRVEVESMIKKLDQTCAKCGVCTQQMEVCHVCDRDCCFACAKTCSKCKQTVCEGCFPLEEDIHGRSLSSRDTACWLCRWHD
jgi:hypothetical protein